MFNESLPSVFKQIMASFPINEDTKLCFAAWGVIQEPGCSTFEIFDPTRGQIRAFYSFDYWEL